MCSAVPTFGSWNLSDNVSNIECLVQASELGGYREARRSRLVYSSDSQYQTPTGHGKPIYADGSS